MASKLSFHYDKIGDILYVEKVKPYVGQDSEELDDYIVARLNPKTRAVENLEILFFTKRLEAGETIEVPLSADLRLVE
jgi:hypothetical protein